MLIHFMIGISFPDSQHVFGLKVERQPNGKLKHIKIYLFVNIKYLQVTH